MFCLRSLTDLVKPVSLCSLCRMWTESLNFTPPILHDKMKEWCHLRHLFSEVPRQQFQLEHPPKSDFWFEKSNRSHQPCWCVFFVCCHISPIHQSYTSGLYIRPIHQSYTSVLYCPTSVNGHVDLEFVCTQWRMDLDQLNYGVIPSLDFRGKWIGHDTPEPLTELLTAELHHGQCRHQVLARRTHEMRKDNLAGSAAYFFFILLSAFKHDINCPKRNQKCLLANTFVILSMTHLSKSEFC